jgi:fatty-acyl-CoA synthase
MPPSDAATGPQVRVANEVDGVRAGNVAAVRVGAGTSREEFAVLVESRFAGDAARERNLAREVTTKVANAVDARPFAVVVLASGSLLKTPSGKIRRAASAAHYCNRFARM